MRTAHLIVLAALAIAAPGISHAQVAGSTLSAPITRRCAILPWVGAPSDKSSGRRSTTT